jgi:protein-tyrosine phosphatase
LIDRISKVGFELAGWFKMQSYYGYEKDPPEEVTRNVYRGPLPDKHIFAKLQDLDTRKIITLCDESYAARQTKEHCKARGLDHHHIPLSPFYSPTQEQIDNFLELLEERHKHPLYIHCIHGRDRTGAMIGIFRLSQGWTFDQAFAEMHKYCFDASFHRLVSAVKEYSKRGSSK